jgi:hypothetical protein
VVDVWGERREEQEKGYDAIEGKVIIRRKGEG